MSHLETVDFVESSMRIELLEEYGGKQEKKVTCGAGSKRKRSILSDEDCLILSSMNEAIHNVSDAIRDNKVVEIHPMLYSTMMYMEGSLKTH